MKLKNVCNKAISIGGTCILPGETGEVSDAFATNASVKMMERIGNLKMVGKTTPPAQEETQGQQTGQTQEHGDEKKPLSRLNKDEPFKLPRLDCNDFPPKSGNYKTIE